MKKSLIALSIVGLMCGFGYGEEIKLEPRFESLTINAPREKKAGNLFFISQNVDRINVTFAVKLPKGYIYKRGDGTVILKGEDAAKQKVEGKVDKFFIDTLEEFGSFPLGKDEGKETSILFKVKIKDSVVFPIQLTGEMPINLNSGQKKLPSVEFKPKEGTFFSVGETKVEVTSVSTNDKKVSTLELTIIEKSDVIKMDLDSADSTAKNVNIETRSESSWSVDGEVQKTISYEITNLPEKLKLTITEASQPLEVKIPINVKIDTSSEKVVTFIK